MVFTNKSKKSKRGKKGKKKNKKSRTSPKLTQAQRQALEEQRRSDAKRDTKLAQMIEDDTVTVEQLPVTRTKPQKAGASTGYQGPRRPRKPRVARFDVPKATHTCGHGCSHTHGTVSTEGGEPQSMKQQVEAALLRMMFEKEHGFSLRDPHAQRSFHNLLQNPPKRSPPKEKHQPVQPVTSAASHTTTPFASTDRCSHHDGHYRQEPNSPERSTSPTPVELPIQSYGGRVIHRPTVSYRSVRPTPVQLPDPSGDVGAELRRALHTMDRRCFPDMPQSDYTTNLPELSYEEQLALEYEAHEKALQNEPPFELPVYGDAQQLIVQQPSASKPDELPHVDVDMGRKLADDFCGSPCVGTPVSQPLTRATSA